MHWDAYTTFSVLSGIGLVACTLFARGLSINERLGSAGFGAAFFAYGMWVGHQDSGTYIFPIWVFVIPFAAVIYLVASHFEKDDPPQPPPAARPNVTTSERPPPLRATDDPVTEE
jgi:hypothetical protein